MEQVERSTPTNGNTRTRARRNALGLYGWLPLKRTVLEDPEIQGLSSPLIKAIFFTCIMIADFKDEWRGALVDNRGRPLSNRYRARVLGCSYDTIARADAEFLARNLLKKKEGRLWITRYEAFLDARSAGSSARQSGTSARPPDGKSGTNGQNVPHFQGRFLPNNKDKQRRREEGSSPSLKFRYNDFGDGHD